MSGEKATAWSERAYKLLRATGSTLISAQQVGEILYLHYCQRVSAKELVKKYNFISPHHVRAVLKGTFCKEVYNLFFEMMEHEREMLDLIFD